MATDTTLLSMEHISKRFPGVQALDDVTLEVAPGEVHALVGENGAGKSTLMKILTGALAKDSGTVRWLGALAEINSPGQALALGISMIHQELALIPSLDVGQNIFLGREPTRGGLGVIAWDALYRAAGAQLARVGLAIDARKRVAELSLAQRQMVEIAKALSFESRLIVMDEPTSSLTEREVETLFALSRSLKAQGVSVVFISHRLEEVFQVADRVTVLRDGRHIGTAPIGQLNVPAVVRMMVGRELVEVSTGAPPTDGRVVLEVRGLSRGRVLRDVALKLHQGEILGMFGLVGSGRTDLARALFGVDPIDKGEVWIEGSRVAIDSPQRAITFGLGFVPEDRKTQGLFLNMAVDQNVTITALGGLERLGFIDFGRMRQLAQSYVERLDIRTPGLGQQVRNLSGGNQQKIVIAKWLTLHPKVLILDEATHGIDVGAKAEIHELMRALARDGVAILMISSELPEILAVSDRIVVMREGRVVGELSRAEASQDQIMFYATGGADVHQATA